MINVKVNCHRCRTDQKYIERHSLDFTNSEFLFFYFIFLRIFIDITNDGICTCEIKCRIAMAKAAFIKKWTLFTSTLDLELRKKLVTCYI